MLYPAKHHRQQAPHLEVHVGVEDLGVVLHSWRDQGILIGHPDVQLEDPSLVRSALRALHLYNSGDSPL